MSLTITLFESAKQSSEISTFKQLSQSQRPHIQVMFTDFETDQVHRSNSHTTVDTGANILAAGPTEPTAMMPS
jgi:hypothetical protein